MASSSNRIRRSATASGPTIMDFMQCLNFKSRLDREKEMIRRKIRSSTLYKKPSFIKSSGFNIYNPLANGDASKITCISKNIKINEFRDEPLRKIKSPLLVVDDEVEDEYSNEEKSILCIGNKYLDLTSSLLSSVTTKAPISSSTISFMSSELPIEKPIDTDFEKAISQSHLSPTTVIIASSSTHFKDTEVSSSNETLKNPKTAFKVSDNNDKIPSDSNDGDDDIQDKQTQSLLSLDKKRKAHTFIKKSNSHFYAVNFAKYNDAQKTEIETELLNQSTSQTQNTHNASSTTTTTSINSASATRTVKKSGTIKKRSNKKSDLSSSVNNKNISPKATSSDVKI